MQPDGQMLEKKSRFSILVIEDNAAFADNAKKGLEGHSVVIAASMDEAMNGAIAKAFDFVLSDVGFPYKAGEEPIILVSEILTIAFERNAPLCFVTCAKHPLSSSASSDHVILKALSPEDVAQILSDSSRLKKTSEQELFRSLGFSAVVSIPAESKTPEIWRDALAMAMNVSTIQPKPGKIIRNAGHVPLGVELRDGMLCIPKK